jgi:hypothetical protein
MNKSIGVVAGIGMAISLLLVGCQTNSDPQSESRNARADSKSARAQKRAMAQAKAAGKMMIITQPQGLSVAQGTPASFKVTAIDVPPTNAIAYQWKKNGTMIAGAIANVFTIPVTSTNDAGMYSVTLSGSLTLESLAAPLAVTFTNLAGNSGGGYFPVNQPAAGPSACCSGFDRMVPAFRPFDGPHVATASVLYPNPTHSATLIIDTLANPTTWDTCLEVRQESAPYTQWCNDDYTSWKTSRRVAYPLATGKTYRVGIYFKSSTIPTNSLIYWSWMYQ